MAYFPHPTPTRVVNRLSESSRFLKESWLDLLAVQLPIPILNHNGEGYRRWGTVWHGWLGIHGTRPDTRRVEWCPCTGGNPPLGAAADEQHQEYESSHPTVSKPIGRDEAFEQGGDGTGES
jgi:hypothetical protein